MDKKLESLLMHCGNAGSELAEHLIDAIIAKTMELTLRTYSLSPDVLSDPDKMTAELVTALQSGIITMMSNCASAMTTCAVTSEIRALIQQELDIGLIDAKEAQSKAHKLMVAIINGVTMSALGNTAITINEERRGAGKPPLFGDEADKSAKAAADAASAALADVLARAPKAEG